MKSLSQLLVWVGAAGLFLLGCERHSFDDTKILHGGHGGDHGSEHHDDKGDGHHKGDDHKGHGDKEHKGAHGEKKAEAKKAKQAPKKEEPRDVGL